MVVFLDGLFGSSVQVSRMQRRQGAAAPGAAPQPPDTAANQSRIEYHRGGVDVTVTRVSRDATCVPDSHCTFVIMQPLFSILIVIWDLLDLL